MALARLFDWVVLLISCGHDLVQMDFIVEELVVLEASERLKHLLDLTSHILNQSLIFNFERGLSEALRFLLDSSLFFVQNALKDDTFVAFRFHLFRFDVNDLSELIHRFATRQDLASYFASNLQQLQLQALKWQISGLSRRND